MIQLCLRINMADQQLFWGTAQGRPTTSATTMRSSEDTGWIVKELSSWQILVCLSHAALRMYLEAQLFPSNTALLSKTFFIMNFYKCDWLCRTMLIRCSISLRRLVFLSSEGHCTARLRHAAPQQVIMSIVRKSTLQQRSSYNTPCMGTGQYAELVPTDDLKYCLHCYRSLNTAIYFSCRFHFLSFFLSVVKVIVRKCRLIWNITYNWLVEDGNYCDRCFVLVPPLVWPHSSHRLKY